MNNFLAQMKNDPRAKELLKALPAPKSEEEALAGYQSVAKQLGFDLSQNEIQAALKAMAQEQKEKTDKVALEDADLESVAGGGQDERCSSTFDRGEWCWFSDSCSYVISHYDDVSKNQDDYVDPFQGDVDDGIDPVTMEKIRNSNEIFD